LILPKFPNHGYFYQLCYNTPRYLSSKALFNVLTLTNYLRLYQLQPAKTIFYPFFKSRE